MAVGGFCSCFGEGEGGAAVGEGGGGGEAEDERVGLVDSADCVGVFYASVMCN